jgi:RNA polymerase sigma-70 factor (ECF subfamily)
MLFVSNQTNPANPADAFNQADFVARLRKRDPAALRQVVHAYLPQLLRAARGAGLNAQNAEDVCQNTFVTFIQKIDGFEGRSQVRTWLFGIMYRKISEMRRAASREGAGEDIDELMESRFKPDGMWARPPRAADGRVNDADIRRHLAECLEGLNSDQRMAFVLREVEEMESEEICNTMEVSRTNLGVLLYRGRNRLRECLEEKDVRG